MNQPKVSWKQTILLPLIITAGSLLVTYGVNYFLTAPDRTSKEVEKSLAIEHRLDKIEVFLKEYLPLQIKDFVQKYYEQISSLQNSNYNKKPNLQDHKELLSEFAESLDINGKKYKNSLKELKERNKEK